MPFKMFCCLLVLLVGILTGVHSVCVVSDACTNNLAVQQEIVTRHNTLRQKVRPEASDMLKMSYSEEVAASAQAWVDKCIIDHGEPPSRMLSGYEMGENLFYASSPYTWTSVIDVWHREEANYLYPNGSVNGRDVGHYTQVVWSTSYRVGCGVALCPNNVYFYGCHYYRAGNFRKWLPYKAGPSCASCPSSCEDGLCTNPCPYINSFLDCDSLKDVLGCGDALVRDHCPASCNCTTEIVPVA